MGWYEAFTLGAVLSATDPVAVVSLLKELGASVRFNTLIEGYYYYNYIVLERLYLMMVLLWYSSYSLLIWLRDQIKDSFR